VSEMSERIRRRNVLAIGGAAAAGAVSGGSAVGAYLTWRHQPAPTSSDPEVVRATVDGWRSDRQLPYFIAEGGAADVAPEHTMPGYQAALGWGARCLDIAVVASSDGELFCHGSTDLGRASTLTSRPSSHTASQLEQARVRVNRLGPRWAGSQAAPLPRLAAVLDAIAGRAVLCVDAVDDRAYPKMVALLEQLDLRAATMIKVGAGSARLKTARKAGYPVVARLQAGRAVSKSAIVALAAGLDHDRDAILIPARLDANTLLPTDLVQAAAATGVPVWVGPVHRRHEARHFSRLGVEGILTPSIGYVSGEVAPLTSDEWLSGGLSPGEMTRDPMSDDYLVRWEEEGQITLAFGRRPSFLALGQFCPIVAPSYRVSFDACFNPLPDDTWQHVSIAFGHTDDRYYEHRLGGAAGYHAMLRADGQLVLTAHLEGDPNGRELATPVYSTPLKSGLWCRLTLDVGPELIRWSRDDGTSIECRDARFRGGYLHIGRSASDGGLRLRNISVA